MAQEPEEGLLHRSVPDNICDPPGHHVLLVHPHTGAAQGAGKGQQEGKDDGDGRAATGKLFPKFVFPNSVVSFGLGPYFKDISTN